jgi:hypothetical protein
MYSKVIGNPVKKLIHVNEVGGGVLFRVVKSATQTHVGLICVKLYSGVIVCVVGNDYESPFYTNRSNIPNWEVEILTTEQVILSNKEIK